MLRFLSAAAFGLAAFLLFAPMSGADVCLTPEKVRASLVQNIPGVDVRELKAASAQTFMLAFNAVPPRSDVRAGAIVLARHAAAPQAVAIFFWKGCMVSRAVLPVAVLDALLASIEKEA